MNNIFSSGFISFYGSSFITKPIVYNNISSNQLLKFRYQEKYFIKRCEVEQNLLNVTWLRRNSM